MPLMIFCVPCQQAVCVACVTEHSAKSHQLMSPLDYAKSVLKAQIGELLAVVTTESTKSTAPKKEDVATWTTALEDLIKKMSNEIDHLKVSLEKLKAWSSNPLSQDVQQAIDSRLKAMIQEIEAWTQTAEIEHIQDIEAAYKEIAKQKAWKAPSTEIFPGKMTDSLLLLKIPEALGAARTQIEQYLSHYQLSDSVCTISKFVEERYDTAYPFLWKLSNNGLTTTKDTQDSTITICGVDVSITMGNYTMIYKLDNYPKADSCDSFGIGLKSSFGADTFAVSGMYGLVNSQRNINGPSSPVYYPFKTGDLIMLVYSSSGHTLSFYVNGKQIGNTITNIPAGTYYTGVAIRSVGAVVTLVSFTKS